MARAEPELDVETTPLDDLDEADPEPVVHRIVPAQSLALPPTRSPRSVFDLAGSGLRLRSSGRFGASAGMEPAPYRVEREGDTVRVVRLRFEETEEAQERERMRRARQRPPKPTKKAKTRGKKVRTWDGEKQ